jgi:Uma2 family endonuclease
MTIAEFEAMEEGDGYRSELVRGYVVREPPPATYHGSVVVRIAHYLEEHVSARRLGAVFGNAGFVLEETPPTVRGPDVAFLSAARIPADAPRRGFWRVGPDLAVEVLSPSDRRARRGGDSAPKRSRPEAACPDPRAPAELRDKVNQYFAAGVRIVWLVDPTRRRSQWKTRLISSARWAPARC